MAENSASCACGVRSLIDCEQLAIDLWQIASCSFRPSRDISYALNNLITYFYVDIYISLYVGGGCSQASHIAIKIDNTHRLHDHQLMFKVICKGIVKVNCS